MRIPLLQAPLQNNFFGLLASIETSEQNQEKLLPSEGAHTTTLGSSNTQNIILQEKRHLPHNHDDIEYVYNLTQLYL